MSPDTEETDILDMKARGFPQGTRASLVNGWRSDLCSGSFIWTQFTITVSYRPYHKSRLS